MHAGYSFISHGVSVYHFFLVTMTLIAMKATGDHDKKIRKKGHASSISLPTALLAWTTSEWFQEKPGLRPANEAYIE